MKNVFGISLYSKSMPFFSCFCKCLMNAEYVLGYFRIHMDGPQIFHLHIELTLKVRSCILFCMKLIKSDIAH
jgi:hypothetical protein